MGDRKAPTPPPTNQWKPEPPPAPPYRSRITSEATDELDTLLNELIFRVRGIANDRTDCGRMHAAAATERLINEFRSRERERRSRGRE